MTALWRSLWGVAGAALGLGVFALAARGLAGLMPPQVGHAGLGLLALVGLWLAFRRPATRLVTLPAGISLLVATILSAAVVPGLIRGEAAKLAAGRPFCLLGPEVRVTVRDHANDPYRLLPALSQHWDLTAFALAGGLRLIVEHPEGPQAPVPGEAGDLVFESLVLAPGAAGFAVEWRVTLRSPGDLRLVDCVPVADPFASSETVDDPMALTLRREVVSDAGESPAWGPRLREGLRLPAAGKPWFDPVAEVGLTLPLVPDAPALDLRIIYPPDPAAALLHRLQSRVRDRDAPVDFAALAEGPSGLRAYEVPSTSVAGAIEGTYAAFGADGLPMTAIGCDPFFCRHHIRAAPHRVVTVTYPVALLPRWREIEAATVATVEGFVLPDPG